MARVSFVLRSTATDKGSYLRYDPTAAYRTSGAGGPSAGVVAAARIDADSALRADGLQLAPLTFTESFFEGTSVCYNEVDLSWGVPLVARDVNQLPVLTATPQAVDVIIVYSPLGEPQTINSGMIIVDSYQRFSSTYPQPGQPPLPEGRWAYFSMFVHFQDNTSDGYYERVATLSVLVPKNYGSTQMLWERIPEHYRIQDIHRGDSNYSPCIGLPPGETIGPLYKYLSIIGFDIDRMRTLLDYIMVAQDPALANTETLDALSHQMAALFQSNDLGSQRLRAFMNDIGSFRRSKGTPASIDFLAQSITGGNIDIDPSGSVKAYSQRVNYVTVPKTATGIVHHRPAHVNEIVTPLAFADATYAAPPRYTVSGQTYTTNGSGASVGVTQAMFHIDSPIPVKNGDTVLFSVSSGIGTIKWVRLMAPDGAVVAPPSTVVTQTLWDTSVWGTNWDSTITGIPGGTPNLVAGAVITNNTTVNGIPVFSVTPVGLSDTVWTDVYVEFLVDLTKPFVLEKLLAERNYVGPYFDGDTVRGGWIGSSSYSDYRWNGSKDTSVSLYAEDYKRSSGILNTLIWEAFPVTELSKYSITEFDAVPGFA